MNNTEKLKVQAISEIDSASDLSQLDLIRVDYLGKKGQLTQLLKQLGKLPADERPQAGQIINVAKVAVQNAIDARKSTLENERLKGYY